MSTGSEVNGHGGRKQASEGLDYRAWGHDSHTVDGCRMETHSTPALK